MNLVGTTHALHQHSTATPSIFNTASSADLGEEQATLNCVGTTQALHQHSMATPSKFNTASSDDLGEEQALLSNESCWYYTSTAPAQHGHALNIQYC